MRRTIFINQPRYSTFFVGSLTTHFFGLFICCILCHFSGLAQYYFKGEVVTQSQKGLPFVQLHVLSTNQFYYTGSSGAFGFPSRFKQDSVTVSLDGYEEVTVLFDATSYFTIQLLPSSKRKIKKQTGLLSIIKNKAEEDNPLLFETGETYSKIVEHEETETAKFPNISFSLNIDKASYSNIRRFIQSNSIVPNHAVRIEEMLNYFPQKEKYIPPGGIFHFESQLTPSPWNEERRLLFMQLQTKKTNFDFLPPSHLIILVDVSGSMDMPNRLPLLKTAFRMLVNNLRECDTLSILSYGGGVMVELPRTPGYEKEKIYKAIENLSPGGETPGESALNFAYEYAKNNFVKDGLNRIILATDGDFNVGKYTEQALMELVSAKKEMGIFLTCLGVGVGNYKDSKLEVMAKKGNGNFAYIDNVKEGEKILVNELMQTLYVVAHNASANVEFDSSSVKYYRLIGYENPVMNENQQERILEGGEIGTGHTVTAVFEIETKPGLTDSSQLLGTMELAYQLTDTGAVQKEKYYCWNNYKPFPSLDSNYVFLAAVAEFGMLLRNAKYLKNSSWDHLKKQTAHLLTATDFWKKEMGELVLKAADIYEPEKKKKKKRRKLLQQDS